MFKQTLALALALVGCGGTVMTCPRVETPVLLGPVDRIGGAPHEIPSSDRILVADAELSLQIAHGAGGLYTNARRTPQYAGAEPIWIARLRRDDDVRVTSAHVTGFVWDAFGVFWMDNEIRVDMNVTNPKAGAK